MINSTKIDTYQWKWLISRKLKQLEMNIDNKLKLAHVHIDNKLKLAININQKVFSFKYQTLLLCSLFPFRTFLNYL